ncbi:TetR/AcrR family transcriptional regulator [Arabiibacter massiliensis]|uniref:TetR/AcrR family transcriptional regulator n=1 Tax=Arabiibacter massiliensis TaxID=1870985 RepID=UPI0009BB11FE|nr:TetR/AcrR family transcriptional regulator [Arabiibacter massiliensis]
MAETSQTPKSLKAQITRTSLVLAAAALLREQGPKAVTYRKVAKWAGAASSSVGYYFDSVTQLLHEAGRYNIQLWAERAEKAASAAEALSPEECRASVVDMLIRACLPDESVVPSAHYAQLIAAAESDVVTEAYQKGRVSLDAAIGRILAQAGIDMPPRMVGTVVDGAAVAAISEGYDVRKFASNLLKQVIETYEKASRA